MPKFKPPVKKQLCLKKWFGGSCYCGGRSRGRAVGRPVGWRVVPLSPSLPKPRPVPKPQPVPKPLPKPRPVPMSAQQHIERWARGIAEIQVSRNPPAAVAAGSETSLAGLDPPENIVFVRTHVFSPTQTAYNEENRERRNCDIMAQWRFSQYPNNTPQMAMSTHDDGVPQTPPDGGYYNNLMGYYASRVPTTPPTPPPPPPETPPSPPEWISNGSPRMPNRSPVWMGPSPPEWNSVEATWTWADTVSDDTLTPSGQGCFDHAASPFLTDLLPSVPHWYLNFIDQYYEGDIPDAMIAMLLDDPDHLVMEGMPDHGEIN